jgi:hypothetical protein
MLSYCLRRMVINLFEEQQHLLLLVTAHAGLLVS